MLKVGDEAMDDKWTSLTEPERLRGINSLLAIGEVQCDKCGKTVRHLERYCCNTLECPTCEASFDTITELKGHFGQQHPLESSRGARYCADCSLKAGYLKMVRNKKTGEIFPVMFTSVIW